MNISILGSATVAQTLGSKLVSLGHQVMLGSRDPDQLDKPRGNAQAPVPPLRQWLEQAGPHGSVGSFAQATQHGELVINAVAGDAALLALQSVGADHLEGKVLVDVSNVLDSSKGWPPTLFVDGSDSLAEQIQREFPRSKVVKTLNTMSAAVMIDPTLVGADSTVFVSGNDDTAKRQVEDLLRSFGWTDILDLGDLSTARGPEQLFLLTGSLLTKLNFAPYQYKIVRRG